MGKISFHDEGLSKAKKAVDPGFITCSPFIRDSFEVGNNFSFKIFSFLFSLTLFDVQVSNSSRLLCLCDSNSPVIDVKYYSSAMLSNSE